MLADGKNRSRRDPNNTWANAAMTITRRVVESEERRLLDTSRERRVALECISSKSHCKQRAFSVLPMREKRNQISDDLHKDLSRNPAVAQPLNSGFPHCGSVSGT